MLGLEGQSTVGHQSELFTHREEGRRDNDGSEISSQVMLGQARARFRSSDDRKKRQKEKLREEFPLNIQLSVKKRRINLNEASLHRNISSSFLKHMGQSRDFSTALDNKRLPSEKMKI